MDNQPPPRTLYFGKSADTPLGAVWVAQSEKGLFALEFGISREKFEQHINRLGPGNLEYEPNSVALALEQVEAYLAKELIEFKLQVDWSHFTDFQVVVLNQVMKIPYGSTATYGEIASKIGKPGTARAVGRANATNPIPLVIPCHRVLGSDGGLRGYGGKGGVKTKAWLLALENGQLDLF